MIKLLTGRENRNFLRLWVAQLISQFGDRIHQLALIALIAERTGGSATSLAKVISFTILPVFIIQPFAGVLVDRLDRRTTLFVCDIIRAALVFTIPFYFIHFDTMVPIYIMVFLIFSFSRFYVPAKMSIIPDLVNKNELIEANSLVSSTALIAFVLGAALGGYYIEIYGSRNGFIIDGLTFLFSAVFLMSMDVVWRLKINAQKIHDAEILVKKSSQTVFEEIKEGFDYIVHNKEIRLVLGMIYMLLSAAGASYVVLVVFVQQAFGSITKDLGVLAVCLGAGLFIGFMAYGKWGKRFKWHTTIFACLIFGGAMMIAFALCVQFYANLYLAMMLAVVWGIVIGPVFIAANTVVHLMSKDDMRGKMFSALEIVIHFAFLVAMMVSSFLEKYIQIVWILVGVGGCVIVFSFFGLFNKKIRQLS